MTQEIPESISRIEQIAEVMSWLCVWGIGFLDPHRVRAALSEPGEARAFLAVILALALAFAWFGLRTLKHQLKKEPRPEEDPRARAGLAILRGIALGLVFRLLSIYV